MSSLRPQDRKSLCRFTFADGRQCRTPRSPHHPRFCSDHARKDSQARAADKLARELSYFFSGQYLSACDLSAALGRLLPAVVRGDIKPRSARNPRLSLPNSRPNHPSCRAGIHQRLRHRFLAPGRPQFRPPKLRLPPSLPVTRTATGSGSPTIPNPAAGPIAAHSPASHEQRIHSACSGRSFAFCASGFRPGRPARNHPSPNPFRINTYRNARKC